MTPTLSAQSTRSLQGSWRFALDPNDRGTAEQWYGRTLQDRITLPGSCEQAGYGTPSTTPAVGRLTRVVRYEGKAWYQRDVEIPSHWAHQRIELLLERCHWQSQVWIDNRPLGMQNSLSAPHLYDLGALSPGRHRLTICIDNTYKIPIGTWVHAITEDTQGNWNGIIGRIELRATPQVWIRNVQCYDDHLQVCVGNATGRTMEATLNGMPCSVAASGSTIRLPFTPKDELWSEFTPRLHPVTVTLQAEGMTHRTRVDYGRRTLTTRNKQFVLNGYPILMRGPVDECVYPLTGYPPMDLSAWMRVLKICKSYGFNYMRFHSWCPPEAAFEAADRLGFFFQVEIPLWTMDAPHYGADSVRDQFIRDELDRILTTYGNHPSFTLMAMGNESSGSLSELVQRGRATDPRHLYRCENGDSERDGDFFETGQRGVAGPRTDWTRWTAQGWIAGGEGSLNKTGAPVPTLSHEVGQWAMYPDFDEIDRYTGTLRAYNFEGYRRSLAAHGMADQNKAFAQASGQLSILLYKEEIEASLRTHPHGGFQVLEARDYPGQGTAIVGWLNAFWQSKGLIRPQAFRRFCNPVVVLAQLPQRVFTIGDTLHAATLLANYGPQPLQVAARWTLTDERGHMLHRGTLSAVDVQRGSVTPTGRIHVPVSGMRNACRMVLTVEAGGTSNSWNLWAFPASQAKAPDKVRIAYTYDRSTREALERGERVVLFSDPTKGLYPITRVMLAPDSIRLFEVRHDQNALEGSFMPAFWNMRLFNQVGTLGLLCDPQHPALRGFPTESHSDWQWADLLGRFSAAESFRTAGAPAAYCDDVERTWGDVRNRSKAIVLNDTPDAFRPIVQVIDNYERNYKLGLIFETRVGAGRLLVCAMDLDTDCASRPAARQLKSCLLNYAASEQFAPQFELSQELLERILTFDQP